MDNPSVPLCKVKPSRFRVTNWSLIRLSKSLLSLFWLFINCGTQGAAHEHLSCDRFLFVVTTPDFSEFRGWTLHLKVLVYVEILICCALNSLSPLRQLHNSRLVGWLWCLTQRSKANPFPSSMTRGDIRYLKSSYSCRNVVFLLFSRFLCLSLAI